MAAELKRKTDTEDFTPGDIHEAVQLIHVDLQNIKTVQLKQAETLEQVHSILTVFNDAKGFIHTVQVFGRIAMWVSLFLGGMAAVWLAIKNK